MLKIFFLVAALLYGVSGQAPAVRYEVKKGVQVCVLAKFGLLLSIKYPKADNSTGSTPLMFRRGPNVNVTGTCAEHGRNVAVMDVRDSNDLGLKLVFTRNETHPHRIYFLSEFEVWYVYTRSRFPDMQSSLYGTMVSVFSEVEWFQAPEEFSYLCASEQRRNLHENVDIVLSDLQLQPFEVKHNDFSTPLECALDSTPVPPVHTTLPSTTLKPVPSPGNFNLTDNVTGDACALFQIGAQFSIDYETASNTTERAMFYLPSDATPTGTCGESRTVLSLTSSEDVSLSLTFEAENGTFTIAQIVMTYVEKPPLFPDAKVTNKTRSLTHVPKLGPLADLGESYRCNSDYESQFSAAVNFTVYDVKVQPFQVVNDTFGDESVCDVDMTTPVPTTTPQPTTTPIPTTTPPQTTPGNTTTPGVTTPGVTTTPLPENSTTTPVPDTPTPPPAEGKWHVTGADGKPCLLADSVITLHLKYNISKHETKTVTVDVPSNATASGSCETMASTLELTFQPGNFSLQLGFAKTAPPPNNANFVLKSVGLRYQEDPTIFNGTINPNKDVDIKNGFLNLFQTAVGKSYRCQSEVEVQINKSAEILFQYTKIQPFGVEGGKFGEESVCSEDVPTIPPPTATSKPAPTYHPHGGNNGGAIAAGILVPLICVILAIAGFIYYRKRRGGGAPYKSL
ncbi:LAMP1 [Branchiostoma lanceolatum]|uniref:Lysosome-associated membrane glycoprotein 5 n=1 Tax=Branchiostoma lanceolatum TaxID=7740 RepID=A0A8J9Z6Z2_BRALA|nr:LAMP1 [Branchiostoma lanceolatum]CAH1248232.1 LAMP1 [Branchiostoma lanceolatum]